MKPARLQTAKRPLRDIYRLADCATFVLGLDRRQPKVDCSNPELLTQLIADSFLAATFDNDFAAAVYGSALLASPELASRLIA